MKKTSILAASALIGLTIPFALSNNSVSYQAEEGELQTSESFSIEESSFHSSSETSIVEIGDSETAFESAIESLENKVKALQETKTYALISAIVAIAYALWGILDKILSKAKAKEIAFNSTTISEIGEEIKKQADKIAELEKVLAEKQDVSNASLVANKEELEQAIIAFTNSIDSVESLKEGQDRIVKALLEICKCDDDLIKSGAFQKIVSVLHGATKDE